MGLGPHRVRRTSRRAPASRRTCGIALLLSTTCPDSTSPGGQRLDIATLISLILPGAAELPLQAETMAILSTIRACRGQHRELRTSLQRSQRAGAVSAVSGFPIFAAARRRSLSG